jgi:hypothetical protein
VIRRFKLQAGWIACLGLQPNVLKAVVWLGLRIVLLRLVLARLALRTVLSRRGWVHRSALPPPAQEGA